MAGRRGFNLIELLVVIAIVTLLMSILMAGLSKARKMASHTAETAAAAQLNTAFVSYSTDHRDAVMPAYIPPAWAFRNHPNHFTVWDDVSSAGQQLEGPAAQPYPWRLAPYLNYDTRALIVDKQLWNTIRQLPKDSAAGGYGYQAGVALYPSFGINSTYVGGDYERGAFRDSPDRRPGRFYVSKASEPTFPAKLIIFTTARGDMRTNGEVVPGWFRVDAPYVLSEDGRRPVPWGTPYWDPEDSPAEYGWLDLRHSDKGIATHFDGHVESFTNREFRDMRRWSNEADAENWVPQPR